MASSYDNYRNKVKEILKQEQLDKLSIARETELKKLAIQNENLEKQSNLQGVFDEKQLVANKLILDRIKEQILEHEKNVAEIKSEIDKKTIVARSKYIEVQKSEFGDLTARQKSSAVAKEFAAIGLSNEKPKDWLNAKETKEYKSALANVKKFEEKDKDGNYADLTDKDIVDFNTVKMLYAKKYKNTQDRKDAVADAIKFIEGLLKLKATRETMANIAFNGTPEEKSQIEQAEKQLASSVSKFNQSRAPLTAKKMAYQEDSRPKSVKEVDYDFTEVTKSKNDAWVGVLEAQNNLEMVTKGLAGFQEIVKQETVKVNAKIIDFNQQFSQVAEPEDKSVGKPADQIKEAEKTAEKIVEIVEKTEEKILVKKRFYKKKIAAEMEVAAQNEAKADEERLQKALEKNSITLFTNANAIIPTISSRPKSAADSYDVFKSAGLVQNEIDFNRQLKNEEKLISTKEERQREALDRELKQEEKYQQRKNESNLEYENRLAKAREERKAEQLARDLKQEKLYEERKAEQQKRYEQNQAEREALAAKRHSEQLEKMAQMDNSRMTQAAKGALVAGAGMLGVYGVGDSIERGIRTGVEFGSNLNLGQAIGGYDDKTRDKMEKNAIAVASATKATTSELPLLQVELTKLGILPDAIIKATGPIVKFSAVFQTELQQTAAVAGKWSKVLGIEIPRMMDIMGQAFRNTSIKDLSQMEELLASGSAMAKALGYSAEQTMALLATAADGGQKADEASRGLQKLVSVAKNANSEFAKYYGGTANNYDELISRIKNMTKEDREYALAKMKSSNLTEENAKNLLVILTNAGDKVDELRVKLENSDGLIENSYEKSMTSLKNQWELVTSAIEAMVVTNYKELEPSFLALTKSAQRFLAAMGDPDSSVSKLTEGVKALTIAVTSFVMVGGGVVGVGTALKAAYALMLANPITATIAGISALGVAIYSLVDSENELLEKEKQRLEIQKQNNSDVKEYYTNVEKLAKEFEELQAKENKSNVEQDRLNTILGDLKKIYPDVISSTNNHALALDQVKRAANDANNKLLALSKTEKIREVRRLENEIAINQVAVNEKAAAISSKRDWKRLAGSNADKHWAEPENDNVQFLADRQTELQSRANNPEQFSLNAVNEQIELLNARIIKFKDDGVKGFIFEQTKEMLDDALAYSSAMEKLVVSKKELEAFNPKPLVLFADGEKSGFPDIKEMVSDAVSPKNRVEKPYKFELIKDVVTPIPCRKCGTVHTTGECPLDNKNKSAAEIQAEQSAQLAIDLIYKKNRVDRAKFDSDQDLLDFNKKREYIKLNHEYQLMLADQAVVNFTENNEAKREAMIQQRDNLKNILNSTNEVDNARVYYEEQSKSHNTNMLGANLDKMQAKSYEEEFKAIARYENASYELKEEQLDLKLATGQLSYEDYLYQREIDRNIRQQNIALAERNVLTAGNVEKQQQLELVKLRQQNLDFENEETEVKLRYATERSKLDKDAKNYKTELALLDQKEIEDLEKINQLKFASHSRTAILNLQNRQSRFIKDYSSDSAILAEEFSQKKRDISNNTNITSEEKAAQLEKLAKDQSIAEKQLVDDFVQYGLMITQKTVNIIQKISDAAYQQDLDKAKRKYAEETKLADKSYQDKVKANQGANRTLAKLADEEEKAKEAREKAQEARLLEIQKKKQKWAAAEVLINIGVAISKALAQEGVLGWIDAAAMTVAGAVQIAQINAQQFNDGRVNVNLPDNENDRILAWIGSDEAIINPASSKANAPLLNSINEAKGLYNPSIPTIQPFVVNNVDTLIHEIRMMRSEAINNTEKISGSVDAKSWSVLIKNENKIPDSRVVSKIVSDGNAKNAKLTVFGRKND